MASKFAEGLLEKIDQGDGMLVALEVTEYEDLIDAELAEVREVLDGLRYFECWCTSHVEGDMPRREDAHDRKCQRARQLYERLEVK